MNATIRFVGNYTNVAVFGTSTAPLPSVLTAMHIFDSQVFVIIMSLCDGILCSRCRTYSFRTQKNTQ